MNAFVIVGRLCLLMAGVLFPMIGYSHDIGSTTTASRMVEAANRFLDALSPQQRDAAVFSFEDKERLNWNYVPVRRSGLSLKEMSEHQRQLADRFLEVGISESGYRKVKDIIRLEAVLREIETWNWRGRDPGKYYFSFFGTPSETGTWGWRLEGHHLSLNLTIANGHRFATAPRFLGANPAVVHSGPHYGLRALAKEEDLGRELLMSLTSSQRKKAVFRDTPYRDIVTGSDETVSPLSPVGIAAGDLSAEQRDLLAKLIDEYVTAMPPDIARQRMVAIRQNGYATIHFGWAGGLEKGQPHYYRIQGPTFLIEYDNVQNKANHIHTVWRDFDGDFGRDLLGEHYRAAH